MSHAFNDSLSYAPAIEAAIDRHPLIVSGDTPVVDAINLMHKTRCHPVTDAELAVADPMPLQQARSSCVLVMEGEELVGIFTERDIVRLVAAGVDFETLTVSQVMAKPVVTLPSSAFVDVFAALFLFRRFQIRHLPIVGDACSDGRSAHRNEIVGVVSPESIRRILRPANLLKLRRVSEVMTTPVLHAPQTTSVLHLAQLMAKHRVSCVVITEEAFDLEDDLTIPRGIITERDIVQFQVLQLDLLELQAKSVMSTPLFLLRPEDSLWTAHQEMQQRHVRRLVVSWDWGKGLGIVTQTNLMRVFDPIEMYEVVETLQRTIQQLESEKAQRKLQLAATSAIASNSNLPEDNLSKLLCAVQISLQNLANQPDMSPDLRQTHLHSALANVEQIQSLVQQLEGNKL